MTELVKIEPKKTVDLNKLLKVIKKELGNKEYRLATAMTPQEKIDLLLKYYPKESIFR